MTYKTLNGALFKAMVVNGAINLKNNYKEIDKLNVFPVPDGDTGTNMFMTIFTGVKELRKSNLENIVEISKLFSRNLLMGARGNSGVILSQFFRGLSSEIERIGKENLTIKDIVQILVSGYQMSYRAVVEPVEGTILTVIRESATEILRQKKNFESVQDLFDCYLDKARKELANTPNLLPILKEAGVVDSGGAGFVKIVEGIVLALQGEIIEENSEGADYLTQGNANFGSFDQENIKFGYCTEFIIKLFERDKFDIVVLQDYLRKAGDSLVVVQDDDLVKVHVHTNKPGQVINNAQKHGSLQTVKIENMKMQHTKLVEIETAKDEVNVLDIPIKEDKYALIAVLSGNGIKKTFKELGVHYIVDGFQSMNPPTTAFIEAAEKTKAENIIILPNNSNVILTAEQAGKLIENKNIKIIPTKNIAQGYSTLISFDPTVDIETNFESMSEAAKSCIYGDITYSIRDTEINGLSIHTGDFIGLVKGQIKSVAKTKVDAAIELFKTIGLDDKEMVIFFYGKDMSKDDLNKLKTRIKEINNDIEIDAIPGDQEIYSIIFTIV